MNKLKTEFKKKSLQRALVIGGGGALGNAWLIGVISGLFDGGLDVTQADLIIGTSAGSTTAVQISSETPPPEIFSNIVSEVHQRRMLSTESDTGRTPNRRAVNHMETTNAIINAAVDLHDMRRKIGAWALANEVMSSDSAQAQWRATVAARLPSHHWPERRLLITAVNAYTGEPVIFDRDSGVDLVDAVAASCAGGFAYRIGETRYIDGGYRANADNADLAAGHNRVLILSPFGGRSRTPVNWGTHLTTQISELRANGGTVETIFPDHAALDAFGDSMMDLSRRSPSARAGYNQGKALAEPLIVFWR